VTPDVQAALDMVRRGLLVNVDNPEWRSPSHDALDVLARELERLEGYLREAERDVVTYRTERDEALDLLKDAEADRNAERARADRLAEALRRLLALYESRTMSEYERAEFVAIRDLLAEHGSPEEARP
jgi:hypothetical protein